MELALWTYEGPPHIGAMRVASAMRGVHYVLHAPQGDTYADLLFTMIERRDSRPPVTYTTFQARDLGSDTAELFKTAVRDANARHAPALMLVGASCTAELLQDDPGGLAATLGLGIPVVPLELPAYSKKENWGAAETFYRIVRTLAQPGARGTRPSTGSGRTGEGSTAPSIPVRAEPVEARAAHAAPRCNILGPAALGFRHRDDLREVQAILAALGIAVNVVAPLGASPADIARLGEADFNVVLYPEIAGTAAAWLTKAFGQPAMKTIPIGVGATRDFIAEVAALAGVDPAPALALGPSNLPWFSRSVDSTYLTAKRVFVFGDAAHAIAAARVATEEFGFTLAGLGTYDRSFAREVRVAAARYGVEALIADDHLAVEEAIVAAAPELVLGTQMERHIAKRLGIACAVISGPFHVQDAPARHSPQMGFEGANVLWDSWVHPLVMGLEEHLLATFHDDAEFHDTAGASHLGAGTGVPAPFVPSAVDGQAANDGNGASTSLGTNGGGGNGPNFWSPEAERELGKIPFFVRGKARRNTEAFARARGAATITLDTLYEAKAHYGR